MPPETVGQDAAPRTARSPAERRRDRRLRVKGLVCNRGQVVDLSARGMRVRTFRRWPEGHARSLTVVDGRDAIPVTARCVWCRQESMFTHVVGLAFEDVTVEQTARLHAIAERHDDGPDTPDQ